MRFENQSAIVTGAGRGIGHAIAVRLASEGARVACVSRSEDNAKRTADELNKARGDSAKHYAVNVADHSIRPTLRRTAIPAGTERKYWFVKGRGGSNFDCTNIE